MSNPCATASSQDIDSGIGRVEARARERETPADSLKRIDRIQSSRKGVMITLSSFISDLVLVRVVIIVINILAHSPSALLSFYADLCEHFL